MKHNKILIQGFFVIILFSTSILLAANGSPLELPKVLVVGLGLISPPIIALVLKKVPEEWRWLPAYLLSLISGIAAMALYKISFSLANITVWMTSTFTYSQLAYRIVWYKLAKKISS